MTSSPNTRLRSPRWGVRVQVTAEPIRMSVAVHKDNVTARVIAQAGAFTITAIDQTADMPYIGNFGFRTSDTYDKFAKYETAVSEVGSPYCPEHACAMYGCRLFRTSDTYDKFAKYETAVSEVGSPYCPEHACAMYGCRLIDTVDVGTHYLFVGEVEQAERLSDEPPLTYAYYHSTLKGKTRGLRVGVFVLARACMRRVRLPLVRHGRRGYALRVCRRGGAG